MRKTRLIAVVLVSVISVALAGASTATAAPSGPLNRAPLAECPDLRVGSTGDCVVKLQKRFVVMGVKINTTGRFGEQTKAAVLLFQGANGFEPTGIADHDTLQALSGNLDQAAPKGAAPAGVVPVSGKSSRPTGLVTSHGVKKCSLTTCSYYLSRGATKQLNKVFNNIAFQVVVDTLASVACAAVGTWKLVCETFIAIGTYAIGQRVQKAASADSCLEVRIGRGLIRKFTKSKLAVDNGINCID
jgi:hypothetical protein